MENTRHVPLRVNNVDIIAEIAVLPQGAMVAIRPICEAIGIAENKQQHRISADPRFNYDHMVSVAADGKKREMFCLPVEQVGPWLYTINSNKVKSEVRDVLLQFQQHLTRELNAAIFGHISIEKVDRLEKQVASLIEQVNHLTQIIFKQQEQINLHDVMVNQEQTLASVGGKLMSRARATKHIRDILHNQ